MVKDAINFVVSVPMFWLTFALLLLVAWIACASARGNELTVGSLPCYSFEYIEPINPSAPPRDQWFYAMIVRSEHDGRAPRRLGELRMTYSDLYRFAAFMSGGCDSVALPMPMREPSRHTSHSGRHKAGETR